MADNDRDEIEQLIKRHCQTPPADEEFARSLAARAKRELIRNLQPPRSEIMDRPTMESTSKTARPSDRHATPAMRRARKAALAIAAVAATVLACVWLWPERESRGWAQVVDAVRAKSWVHGVATGAASDKTAKSEMWFSMKNAVAAGRHGDWAIYDDGRAGVQLQYDPSQKQIYRLSATPFTKEHIRALQAIFSDLFRGSEKLGADFGGTRVVKQQRRQVSENGRQWIEYTLSFDKTNGITGVVFRVDPQTLLPQSMEYVTENPPSGGPAFRLKYAFDYPNEGPADIYALGVPRSAKIVDRVPTPDLARVLEGVRSSRRKFADSYYAIVVETIDMKGRSEKWWQASTVHQVWCKGDCWRVEAGFRGDMPGGFPIAPVYMPSAPPPTAPRPVAPPPTAAPSPAPPPADADRLAWWRAHLKDFSFGPSGVCDGKAIYAPQRLVAPGEHAAPEKTVWDVFSQRVEPGLSRVQAASFGPAGLYMPDLYAYPVGIGNPSRETTIELEPQRLGDVAGALLLKYQYHNLRSQSIPSCRYWVDPARGYVTLRYELDEPPARKGPEATSPDTYLEEDLAQTPTGVWYAKTVRRLFPGPTAQPGAQGSMVYWFFIDFKADIPDSLFKPGQVAVKKATTPPASRAGTSNLKEIAAAMHDYHRRHETFPAAYTVDRQGKPLLSWRVALLPCLGQEELYKQFHLDEPWDSRHNRTLIGKMPDVYRLSAAEPFSPPDTKPKEPGRTNFVVPVGKETVFPGSRAVALREIRHGCANTIMIVEVGDEHAATWTQPEDLPFDSSHPAAGLAALPARGFWAATCDASVRWFPPEFDRDYLRAVFTRANGFRNPP